MADHFGRTNNVGWQWEDGDFDGDGEVAFSDLLLLSDNSASLADVAARSVTGYPKRERGINELALTRTTAYRQDKLKRFVSRSDHRPSLPCSPPRGNVHNLWTNLIQQGDEENGPHSYRRRCRRDHSFLPGAWQRGWYCHSTGQRSSSSPQSEKSSKS